jgi:hypothetical protein
MKSFVTQKLQNNQHRAIRRELKHVDPTLLKNPFDAGWVLGYLFI